MELEDEIATLEALWERERRAARERYREERRDRTLEERVARGHALANLEIAEIDAAAGGRLMLRVDVGGDALDALRMRRGEPVILWWDDPEQTDAVRAVIGNRRRDDLALIVDSLPARLEEGSFHVDRTAPEVTFDRGRDALRRAAEHPLAPVLFGLREAAPPAPVELRWVDDALHEAQREAVTRALGALEIALVHGPPGTGKTRTLAEVVRQAVARGERVLVSAASNTAVDNLCERLRDLPIVRIGHPARVAEELESLTLDAQLRASDAWRLSREWMREAEAIRHRARSRGSRGQLGRRERREMYVESGKLRQDARKHLERAQEVLLDRARVVAATAAGAASRILAGEEFDLVVLDEATQASDPIALVALLRARRAVLAGDPQQLPPTILDPGAAREGLGTTFFERLASEETRAILRMQHRMHAGIMRFPSEHMYEGVLEAHPDVAGRGLDDPDPLRPGPW